MASGKRVCATIVGSARRLCKFAHPFWASLQMMLKLNKRRRFDPSKKIRDGAALDRAPDAPARNPATAGGENDVHGAIKQGYRHLIRDFHRLYFNKQNLNKKRCEEFFGNCDNYL